MGTFLSREARVEMTSLVAEVRGYDLDPITDDMRLFDYVLEVVSDGTATIDTLGPTGWIQHTAALAPGMRLTIKEPAMALRATFSTGSTTGELVVFGSPKFNGVI